MNKRLKKYKIDLDPSDLGALRDFFEEHSDYTTFELTHKYGIPASTLRYWKRVKLNIHSEPNVLVRFKTRRKKIDYGEPLSPEIWDNGPWFKKTYEDNKIGTYVIAKMIDRSVRTVYKRLNRFKIQLRNHKESTTTKNTCHNREWLWTKYVYGGMTLKEIAEEANVNRYTIANWLAEFNIVIRDSGATGVTRHNKKKQREYREKHGTSPKKTGEEVNRPSTG